MNDAQSAFLTTKSLSKYFGGVTVLSDISLDIRLCEVHAVIGENGAGKSTLMKLMAGNLQPSSGEITVSGKPITFSSPVDAERHGIVLVHQEILLANDLTVAQNIYLGRELRKGIFVDDHAMNVGASAAISSLGIDIEPKRILSTLSIAQRQIVQIARALLVPHKLVIFDEPTASLTPTETDALIKVIQQIRENGAAILYISHRLNEVALLADRVTVLRDGRHVATRNGNELNPFDMARLMVGRDVSKLFTEHAASPSTNIVLEAKNIRVSGFVKDASFSLKQGEILGFAGLVGAGRTELLEGVVGLRRMTGTVKVHGQPLRFHNARQSIKAGIVYLTEDRKGRGLLLQQSLGLNLTLASLKKFTKHFLIRGSAEEVALDDAIQEFDIRTRDKHLNAGQLSGGNQQKLLIGKMMLLDPKIVIIDEPTRGIDIGTKEQIYKFIVELAQAGKSVIVISSEMPELLGLCDRIVVMREGHVSGEVTGEAMNENNIVMLATGVTSNKVA